MIATRILKPTLVAIALVVGGIGGVAGTAATSATASAQSFEFRFGTGGPAFRHHAPRRHFSHRRYGPPRGHVANFCAPRHAVGKARAMGVHRARIVRNAPRRVAVRGFRGGYPIRVVFANRRGCPVIATR